MIMPTQHNWFFVLSPPLDGASNMQIDQCLHLFSETSRNPVTLIRFYRWNQPTVSLGCHQRPELALALEYCKEHLIPWVRRPTAGRAVFHGNELTYTVASNDCFHFPLNSIQKIHERISAALQKGLNQLGIFPEKATGNRIRDIHLTHLQKPCFVAASRHELVQGSRKIVGSAQKKLKRSFLQHGSIPLTIHYKIMADALGIKEKSLRSRTISVSEAAGRRITFNEASQAMKHGFQHVFGIQFKKTVRDFQESFPGHCHKSA